MSTRRCYLAGPMRGLIENNFPKFLSVAERLRQFGFEVLSPAEMDIEAGLDPRGKSLAELEAEFTPQILREVIRRDLDAIQTLRPENKDFLVLLPGWENSRGAGAEAYLARLLGLSIWSLDFSQGCGTLSCGCDVVPAIAEIELRPVGWRLK